MIVNLARAHILLLPRWVRHSLKLLPIQQIKQPVHCAFVVSKRLASTEVLAEQLGVSEDEAEVIKYKFRSLLSISDETVTEAAEFLRSICPSKKVYTEEMSEIPFMLSVSVNKLVNDEQVLLESGFKTVGLNEIRLSSNLSKRRISYLKIIGYIPRDLSVTTHILSKIPNLSHEDAVKMKENIGIKWEDNEKLESIFQHVLIEYLCWRLKADKDTIITLIDRYKRFKFRSIVFIDEIVNILDDLGVPRDFILRNGFMLHAYPRAVKAMINEMPILAGMPLTQALLLCPKILVGNHKLLLEMQSMLYTYGIRNEAMKRCMKIFTFSVETVQNRIEKLLNDPYTCCLIGHPRILIMVVYNKTAQQRMELLRDIDLRCYSIQMLSAATRSNFERFTSNREDRTNGDDMLFFLSHVLNCDKSALRKTFNAHVHWHHIPLITIYSTLKLLASYGFSNKLILRSVHILLYPADHVQKNIDSLTYNKPENAQDWSQKLSARNIYLESFCTDDYKLDEDSVLTKKSVDMELKNMNIDETLEAENALVEWNLVLPMCLYLLEKPYHFTGAGVWANEKDQEIKSVSSY